MTVREAAAQYRARGFAVTPTRGKVPLLLNWTVRILTDDEVATLFGPGVNIGVLNGRPSGGIIDVDIDAPEALAIADSFLPPTDLVFGRESNPASHRIYRVSGEHPTTQFRDVDGSMLVEARSTGTQTVWPPSLHPSGEEVRFDHDGEPTVIGRAVLLKAVRFLAACSLLARHWPRDPGSRHALANALAGYLLRAGLSVYDVELLVGSAARAAGDEEWQLRANDAAYTAKALGENKKTTGGPTLASLLKPAVVAKLSEWLSVPTGTPPPSSAVLVSLADVQPETVRWIDRGRIPLGKVTVLDGDPGLGKSTVTTDIAARVSTGRPMPDGSRGDLDGLRGVVVLSAEDGLADTIRPRLDAAGADCRRIVALTAVNVAKDGPRLPTLDDIEAIEAAIAEVDAALVIVDPLMAYLPTRKNSHNDQEVRSVLAKLAALAEKTGAAIVVVRHLNKAQQITNALYRGGGSIGIIAATRSGLLVAPDPDDESGERRLLASSKCNLGPKGATLAFSLVAASNDVARVAWEGTSDKTADDLLRPAAEEKATKLDEAMGFLRKLLSTGPRFVGEIAAAAKAVGIASRTVDRAKKALGIVPEKQRDKSHGQWLWRLPGATNGEGSEGTP